MEAMGARVKVLIRVWVWGLLVFALAFVALTVRWDRGRRYTCAEVLGPHPTPGHMAILPAGWSATVAFSLNGEPVIPDFSVWDEKHRLVCDAQGKDVLR